ncbi:MAG: hypothetical protein ACP5N1_01270 [Candidatus Woesearchaeota archaeon]
MKLTKEIHQIYISTIELMRESSKYAIDTLESYYGFSLKRTTPIIKDYANETEKRCSELEKALNILYSPILQKYDYTKN